MYSNSMIWLAKNENPIYMLPSMANRHGLICGATGTGKTITLKVMAEAFSEAGVPVFLSDIKGDLSGMSQPGVDSEGMEKRIAKFGLADAGFAYKAFPTRYWDVFGKKGTPIRATVSEMGPLLFSRILGLNDTQEGILNIIFKIADDQNLMLLDLKDLKAMVQFVGDNAASYRTSYGNISTASIGAIQRGILTLQQQGAEDFFGEPALDIKDWLQCDTDGRGFINDMNCEQLFQQPALYSTFLLWMLSEIYDALPEIGDPDKPKLVFFFDEAHLLFNDAPKELLTKVEQVVRLIRSKGVGIFFITQNPTDIPDTVLSQLGNRVEHALRAYSPADMKAVKVAAETFRANPAFDTQQAIQECGTGEALVQFLDEKGAPNVVQRAFILPPQSLMGPVDPAIMTQMVATGEMGKKYNTPVDRESAYELLTNKANASTATAGTYVPNQATPVPAVGTIPTVTAPAGSAAAAAAAAAQNAQQAGMQAAAQQAALAAAQKAYASGQGGMAAQAAEAAAQQAMTQYAAGQAAAQAANPTVPVVSAPVSVDPKQAAKMAAAAAKQAAAAQKQADKEAAALAKQQAAAAKEKQKEIAAVGRVAKSVVGSGIRSFGTQAAKQLFRGLLGAMKK
jgi:DNA helicase HerA-like ATPase